MKKQGVVVNRMAFLRLAECAVAGPRANVDEVDQIDRFNRQGGQKVSKPADVWESQDLNTEQQQRERGESAPGAFFSTQTCRKPGSPRLPKTFYLSSSAVLKYCWAQTRMMLDRLAPLGLLVRVKQLGVR